MSDTEDNNDEFQNAEIENGHISNSRSPADSSTDEEMEEEPSGLFNIDLPASHEYLGKLSNLGGYTLYDDGEIVTLLAIDTKTFVLPGFTLPLVFDDLQESSVVQHFLYSSKLFVLLCSDIHVHNNYEYAVTMEPIEKSVKNGTLYLKCKGRQRCKIIKGAEFKNLTLKLKEVTVRILPEFKLSSPLNDSQLYSLKSRIPLTCDNYEELKKLIKYRRYHVAQYLYPYWVYEERELCFFVKHILAALKKYFRLEFIPKEPVSLSFWFIQNYLLTYEERIELLKQSDVYSRLNMELHYLKENRLVFCNNCSQNIAEQQDVIVLSKDGIQNNFVNPGGQVYEIVTLEKIRGYILIGRASKQFSWFPGYAWTIINCRCCNAHLGWKFTSSTLTPNLFFGLARSSVYIANVATP